MTCIAAIETDDGAVIIGGDSAGVSGLSVQVRADTKVFHNGPYVFGFTSSFRMGQLLHFAFEPPTPPEPDDDLDRFMATTFVDALRKCLSDGGWLYKYNERESGGTFLVGVRGHIYLVDSDFQIGRTVDGYAAVGCGEDLALGVLRALTTNRELPVISAEAMVKAALDAAAYHSGGVSAPFHLVKGGWSE